jgi:hypothetical protein
MDDLPVGTFHRIGAVSVVGGPPGRVLSQTTEGGSDNAPTSNNRDYRTFGNTTLSWHDTLMSLNGRRRRYADFFAE